MNALQPWHLIILVLVVVLLFGAKRLPDAARSVGKSMKIFRSETKDMKHEGESDSETKDTKTEAERADEKQLPPSQSSASEQASTSTKGTDNQVADLQRQLDDLKGQSSPADGSASQKNVT